MLYRCAILILLLGANGAGAGEVATVACSVPDLVRTRERCTGGLWSAIAALPEVQTSMTAVATSSPDAADACTRLRVLLTSVTAISSVVTLDPAHPQPRAGLRLVAGDQMQAVATALIDLTRDGPRSDQVRVADGVVECSDGAPLAWSPIDPTADDLVVWIDPRPILAATGVPGAKVLTALEPGAWEWGIKVLANGLSEHGDLTGRLPPLGAVDTTVLAGIPSEALLVAAVGLDGPSVEAWLMSIGEQVPEVTLGMAFLDQQAAFFAIPSPSEALLGTTGTAFLVVLPSVPVPSVTIALPRSQGMDALVEALARLVGAEVRGDQAGGVAVPMPQGFPGPATLLRSETHWLLSTELLNLPTMAAGSDGTYDAGPVSSLAATGRPGLVLDIANAGCAKVLLEFLPLMANDWTDMPEEQAAALRLLLGTLGSIGNRMPPSRMAVTSSDAGWTVEGENLACGVPGVSLLAGFLGLAARDAPAQQTTPTAE